MLIIFSDVIDQAELYKIYSKTISHGPTQTHTDKFFFPAPMCGIYASLRQYSAGKRLHALWAIKILYFSLLAITVSLLIISFTNVKSICFIRHWRMTFFVRLSQPNKTSVYVRVGLWLIKNKSLCDLCVSLPALLNFSQKRSEADLTGVAKNKKE